MDRRVSYQCTRIRTLPASYEDNNSQLSLIFSEIDNNEKNPPKKIEPNNIFPPPRTLRPPKQHTLARIVHITLRRNTQKPEKECSMPGMFLFYMIVKGSIN